MKKKNENLKATTKFEKKFGGLNKHDLKIQPINVFALKIEYLEEGPAPFGPAPFAPAPTVPFSRC
jgi:hypothetical protein